MSGRNLKGDGGGGDIKGRNAREDERGGGREGGCEGGLGDSRVGGVGFGRDIKSDAGSGVAREGMNLCRSGAKRPVRSSNSNYTNTLIDLTSDPIESKDAQQESEVCGGNGKAANSRKDGDILGNEFTIEKMFQIAKAVEQSASQTTNKNMRGSDGGRGGMTTPKGLAVITNGLSDPRDCFNKSTTRLTNSDNESNSADCHRQKVVEESLRRFQEQQRLLLLKQNQAYPSKLKECLDNNEMRSRRAPETHKEIDTHKGTEAHRGMETHRETFNDAYAFTDRHIDVDKSLQVLKSNPETEIELILRQKQLYQKQLEVEKVQNDLLQTQPWFLKRKRSKFLGDGFVSSGDLLEHPKSFLQDHNGKSAFQKVTNRPDSGPDRKTERFGK